MLSSWSLWAQKTPYELGNGNQTATYEQCISYYEGLAEANDGVGILCYGKTDCGEPLRLVVVSKGRAPANTSASIGSFIKKTKQEGKAVLLVMNGIHPGEPEGIDASMMLARDLVVNKSKLLDDVVLCIIPVYNIGGALNRNCCSRANQNGPEMYGFRGNAKNLDLNRDFIKGDSKNTWAFWKLFQEWKPDVFVDNHTSNGADYQYTMTLIASQKDKQDFGVKRYMKTMLPMLDNEMEKKDQEICPYVNVHGQAMDDEIVAFFESPRYSTGYTSLFGTVSFVAETHMLKPFDQRVVATYQLMESILSVMVNTKKQLLGRHLYTAGYDATRSHAPVRWELDKGTFEDIAFKGYAYEHRESAIPGHKRLFYDRSKPYTKQIKFYNTYVVTDSAKKPMAYILPQAWSAVADRLMANGVLVKRAAYDTSYSLHGDRIESFEAAKTPYEGHFPISKIETSSSSSIVNVHKGDYVVLAPNRFAIETLEPKAHDAFLVWNFFDPILQQKEWFSSYVFEDTAAEILKNDPELLKELEAERKANPEFAKNYFAQLYFVYKRSPYYEEAHMNYPVYKLFEVVDLPIE